MKILIVGKTRRGVGACVGGITEKGASVRLVERDAGKRERAGLEYEVGEVWEVEWAPDPEITAPHVENILVLGARRLRRSAKLEETVRRFMPPVCGGPEKLFEGLTQATASGGLYISRRTGLPGRSTMFWVPDRPLRLDCEGKRIRYRYPTDDGGRTVTFVGFQEPVPEIPAGTLLRVSLAHWWRPEDRPGDELRCFVQLSGWVNGEATGRAASAAGVSRESQRLSGVAKSAELSASMERRALQVLKQTFGFPSFLPVQEEVVARVLARRDTLAVMPTGGGKSLCYQLPALLFEGLTVVVSPLVALMQDQVRQLEQLDVPAACLNHMVPLPEYNRVMHRVREGTTRILYVAPETLLRPETLLMLEQGRLACVAVDEAHCISEWGHDFRPEYRQLGEVRRHFPAAVCLMLTATATARVRQDIRNLLGLAADGEFVASFNRPNLFLAAHKRKDGLGQILAFLEGRRGQSGIIYCGKRKQADELSAGLNANGWAALPYHAGLPDKERKTNQERFIRDEVPLMIATVAFGMGINKSNVRFVVHAHMPKDLESYYQEVGRAGRDGLPADCVLLYNWSDVFIHRHFIQEGAESERPGREARLNAMIKFAEASGCRRMPLLRYFGEKFSGRCGVCDQCVPGFGERLERAVAALCQESPGLDSREKPKVNGESGDPLPAAVCADLFERLRVLRRELADKADLPAYVIFSDRSLTEMAATLPQTEEEFLEIAGVGAAKLARYGGAFLDLIRAYCGERNLPSKSIPKTAPRERIVRVPPTGRHMEVGKMFAAGRTLPEIAERFGVQESTVLDNLRRFVECGGKIDPEQLLPHSRLTQEHRGAAFEAFERLGLDFLGPVHAALKGAVQYRELHLLRLYLLALAPERTNDGRKAAPGAEGIEK